MSVSEQTDTDAVTRRSLTRTVLASGAVVLAPSAVSVVSAETDSGFVEIEATSTIPSSTGISIRVYEDIDGSGTANNQQAESLTGGTETVEYDALDGTEASGVVYWLEITLTTDDGETTPELDSATITLPEEQQEPAETPAQEREGIFELWENFHVFVAVAIGLIGGLAGLASKSMALGGFAAYMVFAYLAVQTGDPILENILYISLVLVIIGMAFKLWRLEFGGST